MLYLLTRFSLNAPSNNNTNTAIDNKPSAQASHINTLQMDHNGLPKNKIYAEQMTHYSKDNTTELKKPKLQIFHSHIPPTIITAESGQVIPDQSLILLRDKTKLTQTDNTNKRPLEILTSDVHLFLDKKYLETKQAAIILSNKSTIKSIGMNAYLDTQKLELLNHVQTTISPPNTWH